MAEIFVASIVSYDSETGQYYIRLKTQSLDLQTGIPARVCSPTPYEDGSGIKSAPVAPADSQCLVMKDGNRHYIIGFLQPHGFVAHGDSKPVRNVTPGDMFLTHSTPSKLGITAAGSILLIASKWAQAAINPVTNQLTAWFKNIRLNFYSMIVEFFADTSKKSSTARITMSKWVNGVGLPMAPPDGSTSLPQDHFTLRAGTLDDDHIIELNITQKDPGTGPQHISDTRLGLQKDGTYFDHVVTNIGTDNKTTVFELNANNDGSMLASLAKDGGNNITAIIDASDDKTNPGVLLDVNGQAHIQIDKDGNITVTSIVDDAKIKIGGTGNEQELVTRAFVENVYKLHTHSNGNAGGPTGTPLTPVVPPVSKDDSSNPYTFTTQAE